MFHGYIGTQRCLFVCYACLLVFFETHLCNSFACWLVLMINCFIHPTFAARTHQLNLFQLCFVHASFWLLSNCWSSGHPKISMQTPLFWWTHRGNEDCTLVVWYCMCREYSYYPVIYYIGIIINKHKDPCEPMVFVEKYEGVNCICLNYFPWIRNPGIPKNSNPANFFNGTYNNISDWVVDSNIFYFYP